MLGLPLIPPPLLLLAQARIEAMPPVVPSVEVVEISDASLSIGPVTWALSAMAAAVVVAAIGRFALHRSNANWQMFRELCRAHELSHSQCRTLRRLARQLRIANPSRLFLEAELWSPAHADSTAGHAPSTTLSRAQEELRRLREQLFSLGRHEPQLS